MNRSLLLGALVVGCGGQSLVAHTDDGGSSVSTGASTGEDTDGAGSWPETAGPCALDLAAPGRLVITTTDFSTGAVSLYDIATGQVTPDLALASTDAIPVFHGGRVHVVNRFQWDYVDVLDPASGWASLGEHTVTYEGVASPNPHGIAFGPSGLGFAPLFGAPAIAVLDLERAPGESQIDLISLGAFADADGNPEATHALACGDVLFVSLERLDANAGLMPLDGDRIVAIDMPTRTPYTGELPVLGEFVKQLRRDPGDPGWTTVLALTTGIERIDLVARTVEWSVPHTVFADLELDHRWLPQSFDVDASGATAYLAAYDPDYAQVRLYRVTLDDPAASLQEIASGFDSVERTLEVVGDRLFYGSTRAGEPGLWVMDLTSEPPTILEGPLSTGLPPYSITVMP